MIYTLKDVVLIVISVLLSIFVERGIRWRKPRIGTEGITTAKSALYLSRMVLNNAISCGGRFPQPWIVDGIQVPVAKLEDELNHAKSAISDKKLSKHIEDLLEQLHLVWVEHHSAPATIAVEGHPISKEYSDWQDLVTASAERQIAAARTGLTAEIEATKRLRKLSIHS